MNAATRAGLLSSFSSAVRNAVIPVAMDLLSRKACEFLSEIERVFSKPEKLCIDIHTVRE